ncbi:MAG TPA: hypothetical protein VK783_12485 [Bacteroidia bacterium]|jgi:hypothetical protein|nr:hypothetical protein [Bacteroidia bacterium]
MKKQLFPAKQYVAIFVIISTIVIVQCTNTKPTTSTTVVKVDPFHPQQTDIPLAQAHWPSVTAEELIEGYKIYSTKCNDCHEMKNLLEFSVSDWPNIMQEMGKKAKLDSIQYNQVWHYIVARREGLIAAKK